MFAVKQYYARLYMNTKLNKIITSIKYGPHTSTLYDGEVKYLKGNHFDEDAQFTLFADSYVDKDRLSTKHLLQEGDVIIASKGYRNFAWRYTKDHGPCVASSLFYVVKVNEQMISSHYFALMMNSTRVLDQLQATARGANMPTIPKGELLGMKLYVPPLAHQKEIVEISNTINKKITLERRLLNESIKLRKGLINKLISNR